MVLIAVVTFVGSKTQKLVEWSAQGRITQTCRNLFFEKKNGDILRFVSGMSKLMYLRMKNRVRMNAHQASK